MKYINIGNSELSGSEIALGCMRIVGNSEKEVAKLITTAFESGINFFDHADIYGKGESERIFGQAMKTVDVPREKMIIQTKCGIGGGMYNFSKEYILEAVEGSLKRLDIDYVDTLLLHRPDTLMEPEEVAEAFSLLAKSGKVKYFGVSNFNQVQTELLQKYVDQKLIINQLQFSIMHTGMIDSGFNVNMKHAPSIDYDGGVLEYCRLKDITIQPWSPFQYGFFEGVFLDHPKFPELNIVLDRIAAERDVTNSAVAIAWILRHPAKMQPILGSTNAKRVQEICKASEVSLTRTEWYEIYKAAGNKLP
ncbi:MAG: aldo/keto reductase [Cellulosilyticaceae bacterium]